MRGKTRVRGVTIEMGVVMTVALLLFPCAAFGAESGPVIVPVTRDTWVSAVGKERLGNNGTSSRLKFKGIQEFSLLDGDFSAFKGRRIARAALRLHQASQETLGRVTVSKRWTQTTFEFYLNNKVYFKAQRGSWSKCSAPWIFDEPVNTQDFWALRRFGREFLAATGGAPNLVFRCDISRPEWQRDLLDGVCGEEVVSGALRTYRERILARQARHGQTVLLYGSPNKIGTPNVQCAAWCLDAWCLGADGVVPWNTIGNTQSWTRPDHTCLFYPAEKGPLPSLRLKAFCHGQQLVEYLAIFAQLAGHDRRSVVEAIRRELGLEGLLKKTSEDDAGTMSYDRVSPESLERMRIRLGSWIAARKPADRDLWTTPRHFGPVDARPDESFFVSRAGP